MEQYEFVLLEQLRKHYIRRAIIEKTITQYPVGSLVKHKKGKYQTFYYHTYENGKETRRYLSPKKDKYLLDLLLKKKTELPALRSELAFRNQAIKALQPLAKKTLEQAVILPVKTSARISENPFERQKLKWTTNRGEKVRSKSEKILADLLYEYNLDYTYEKQLQLKNHNDIYPDFTIISPLSGKTYYWEHNGLTTSEYLKHWDEKNQAYQNANITTSNYLLVTTEEEADNFREIIEENFTLKRYSFFT